MLDRSPPLVPMSRTSAALIADGDLMYLRSYIRAMTRPQRELLARHAEGPQPIEGDSLEARTRAVLVARKLIRYDRPNFPRCSTATPIGRRIVSVMLADQADVLAQGAQP